MFNIYYKTGNKIQQKKKPTKFSANSSISATKEEVRKRRTSTDKLTSIKKRLAPQPPSGATAVTPLGTSDVAALGKVNLSKTTTPTQLAQAGKQPEEQKRNEVNIRDYDHREFIEKLIDSTITLENIEFNINESGDDAQPNENEIQQRQYIDKKPVLDENTKQRVGNDEKVTATRQSIQESESTNASCTTKPLTATASGNCATTSTTLSVEGLIVQQTTESDEPSRQLEECQHKRPHIVMVEKNGKISFCLLLRCNVFFLNLFYVQFEFVYGCACVRV